MEGGKHILIVDDEEDFCFLLKETLEGMGDFQVDYTTDPQLVEAKVQEVNPDIILIDNVMPKRSGAEVVKALRTDPQTKDIPIVMISGRGEMVFTKKTNSFRWIPNSKAVKERGDLPQERSPDALSEIYRVDDYISKPVSADTIISVIQEILGEQ